MKCCVFIFACGSLNCLNFLKGNKRQRTSSTDILTTMAGAILAEHGVPFDENFEWGKEYEFTNFTID